MAPVVRMCHALAGWWPPPPDGHLDGIHDKLGPHVVSDRPADYPAAPGVNDDTQVHLASVGAVLGDVHHPQAVRAVHLELPFHQVLGGCGGRVTAGAAMPLPPVDAGDLGLAHQPLDPLAGAADALAEPEVGVDPGRPVGPP